MRRANDWIDECSLPFPVLLDEFAVKQIKGGEFDPGMVFTVFEVSANSASIGLPGQTDRYRVPRKMMVQITKESARRITVVPVLGHAAEKSPFQLIKLIQPDPNLKLERVILPPS
ncbi:MAG: hypothetical protein VX589_04205, partial [Myxococcota bacterium]|nr:hypothetical protein [Myxococcota bacterium]